VLENLDPDKRPVTATADFRELVDIESVSIRQDLSSAVQLLFDPDHSLEERIIVEQVTSAQLHGRPVTICGSSDAPWGRRPAARPHLIRDERTGGCRSPHRA
jgi:hypothetical protein